MKAVFRLDMRILKAFSLSCWDTVKLFILALRVRRGRLTFLTVRSSLVIPGIVRCGCGTGLGR